MPASALVLYFDGRCPFCVHSMARLRGWDIAGRLAFVDIAAPGFDPAPLGVTQDALNRELHATAGDGTLLVGIDSMLAAYSMAGQGWRVWLLRIRPLRPLLAALYRWFARHRHRFSRLFGYRLPAGCDGETCAVGSPFIR
jgi:predicted DCC family thiol-disulfide oxidoreductase YuxK